MRNIWEIFKRDIKGIHKNAIAWVVVLGLSVVPSLYAWFNIAASWDPYSNTGNLKVAVANTDDGYSGELLPIELNLGEQVITSLRANDQLDWIFTDAGQAKEGVKSGKYYAAIVIPETFSQDMMSLFSTDVRHSDILYYINEKENAIAPKVTDKGATAIQRQIDEIFAETVSGIGLDILDGLSNMTDQEDVQNLISRLNGSIRSIETDLTSAESTVQAFADLTASMQQMLSTSSAFLEQAGENTESNLSLLNEAGNSADGLKNALSGTADSVNQVLSQGSDCYDAVSGQIDQTFEEIAQGNQAAGDGLSGLADEVQVIIDRFTGFRDSLQELGDSLPEWEQIVKPAVGTAVGKLNESIAQQESVRDKLNETAGKIAETSGDVDTYRNELKQLASQSAAQIGAVRADYEENVRQKLDGLFATLGDTGDAVTSVLGELDSGTDSLADLSGSAQSNLGQLKETLDSSAALLGDAARKAGEVTSRLDEAAQNGDLQAVRELLGSGTDSLSSFLAAPVSMKTEALYPVENYGSAMAPFYSTLSIWVGGIVLAAMLKVTVSENKKSGLGQVKDHELYFGRYILFLLIGIVQSTLICLGDLYFLEIQCEHPVLFVLAGWVSSLVYVNIIYTLTVSFGDIGKAVSVVLLVMQVAGSGGTFPIEVAPEFFQKVYPFLPFAHSMAAMRECIAGFYQNTYWMELGKLCLFLVPSLLLGLVLRRPVIRWNTWFSEQLESTKLM